MRGLLLSLIRASCDLWQATTMVNQSMLNPRMNMQRCLDGKWVSHREWQAFALKELEQALERAGVIYCDSFWEGGGI